MKGTENPPGLPCRALCVRMGQASLGASPPCWAGSAVCSLVLSWQRAVCPWRAGHGETGSCRAEIPSRALQTQASPYRERDLRSGRGYDLLRSEHPVKYFTSASKEMWWRFIHSRNPIPAKPGGGGAGLAKFRSWKRLNPSALCSEPLW